MAGTSGVKLDESTVNSLAGAVARRDRWSRLALWIGVLALVVIAWQLID
jgi:hypothetical protein